MIAQQMSVCAADPKLFRQHLTIESNGKLVAFRPDPWQLNDFGAMDAAWLHCIGRGPKPAKMRSWILRPRGHSKTSDQAVMMCWALFAAQRPIRGVAAAADRDQGAIVKDAMASIIRANGWLGQLLEVQRDCVINLKTGSRLDVISSDVASSWGLLVDFVCADEVTVWEREDFFSSLLSTVAKKDNAVMVCIANAGYDQHFAARLDAVIREDPAWHHSHLPGSQASWISAETLAEQRRLLPPLVYSRLFDNVFSKGSSDALLDSDIQAALKKLEGPMETREKGFNFALGVDLGISRDHAAIVLVGRQANSLAIRIAQVRSWIPPKNGRVDLQAVEDAILEIHNVFRPLVFCDPYQCEQMAQRLQKAGVKLKLVPFTGKSKMEMASALVEAFTSQTIAGFPCEPLLQDLRALRLVDGPIGYRLEANRTASGSHCDRAVALSLALIAIKETRPLRSWTMFIPDDSTTATQAVPAIERILQQSTPKHGYGGIPIHNGSWSDFLEGK
jgi:hypothetical protein